MPTIYEKRLDDAFRIMVMSDFKRRVQAMADNTGENVSEMTRAFWENKLYVWEKKQKRKAARNG